MKRIKGRGHQVGYRIGKTGRIYKVKGRTKSNRTTYKSKSSALKHTKR